MKKITFITLSLLLIHGTFYGQKVLPGIDTVESLAMFNYLQKIRQKEIDKSDPMYKYINKHDKLPLLVWNDTLARVARTKAEDLANNNYFDHVDKSGKGINYYISESGYTLDANWLEDPKNNYFESLQAGAATGIESVRFLIIDKGIPGHGHRKHLLGEDEWNFKNIDFGAAFYRMPKESKSRYQSYTVIIIARHHY